MNLSFHPEAKSEFIAAQSFYDDREFGLGEEFLDEVKLLLDESLVIRAHGLGIPIEHADVFATVFRIR